MTPADRIHVYVGAPLRRLLDAWASGDRAPRAHAIRSASQAVNTVADRYQEMVRRSLPALAEAEWMACADGLTGVWATDDAGGAAALTGGWAAIADTAHLGPTWGIDAPALAGRLRAAPYAQQVALIDVIERLWAQPDADWPALLRAWRVLPEDTGPPPGDDGDPA